MRNKWFLLCLLLLLVLSLPVTAEKKEDQQESGTKTFDIKSDHAQMRRKENIYTWTGNIKFKYDDINVEADKLKINKNKKLAQFSGSVHLIRNQAEEDSTGQSEGNNNKRAKNQQAKEEIWSQELDYDYEEEILLAEKEVKLETTKEEKPLKLTSQYLKLWTESNDMQAKEDVFVDYDEQEIKGEHLEYTAAEEKMVVTEQVEIKEEDNWIKSEQAVLWLEDDLLEADGQVEMEFEVEE